ncbi:MAG: hypothetical protein MJ252_23190 [archaeon]|nr:hypothetical protein [archaeon]
MNREIALADNGQSMNLKTSESNTKGFIKITGPYGNEEDAKNGQNPINQIEIPANEFQSFTNKSIWLRIELLDLGADNSSNFGQCSILSDRHRGFSLVENEITDEEFEEWEENHILAKEVDIVLNHAYSPNFLKFSESDPRRKFKLDVALFATGYLGLMEDHLMMKFAVTGNLIGHKNDLFTIKEGEETFAPLTNVRSYQSFDTTDEVIEERYSKIPSTLKIDNTDFKW